LPHLLPQRNLVPKARGLFLPRIWDFEFVSDFDIRALNFPLAAVSDYEFAAAPVVIL